MLLKDIKERRADVSLLSQTLDLPDPEYFINAFESTAQFNFSNYTSRDFDSIISQIRHEPDRRKRATLLMNANNHLYQNAVTINLSYPPNIAYLHRCIRGLEVGMAGESYTKYDEVSLDENCQDLKDFSELEDSAK